MMTQFYYFPGRIISYSMPQGDKRGSSYEFYDWNYDGEWRGEYLLNGLGSLTDSNLGPADFKLGYYAKSKQIQLDYCGLLLFDNNCCSRSWLGWMESGEKRCC